MSRARKTVMVRCEPDVFAALPDDTLRLFDGVLFHDPGLDELQARVRELGVRSYAVPEAGAAGLLPWLAAVGAVPSPPLRALADPLPEWNAAHVSLPADAGLGAGMSITLAGLLLAVLALRRHALRATRAR